MIGRWPSGGGTVANVEKVSVKRAEPYDGHVLAAISFISGRRDAGTYRGDRERNLCSKWPDMHARRIIGVITIDPKQRADTRLRVLTRATKINARYFFSRENDPPRPSLFLSFFLLEERE